MPAKTFASAIVRTSVRTIHVLPTRRSKSRVRQLRDAPRGQSWSADASTLAPAMGELANTPKAPVPAQPSRGRLARGARQGHIGIATAPSHPATNVGVTNAIVRLSRAKSKGRQRLRVGNDQVTDAPQGEEGTTVVASPKTDLYLLADVIGEIREQHRIRCDFHSAEKRLTNQIKAVARRATPDPKRPSTLTPEQIRRVVALVTLRLEESKAQMESHRKEAEKIVAGLAKTLSIYPWVKAVKGAGALGLGQIVAEAGDLSDYSTEARLWKRMGLAVINGERQRCVRGAEALDHGYSPRRRAVMWNIGQSLVKGKGLYFDLYKARKEVEAAKPSCGRPMKTETGVCELDGHCRLSHIDNRARRWMEKRYLRDLWKAWNGLAKVK